MGLTIIPYNATETEVHKLLVMQLQQKTTCSELNVHGEFAYAINMYCEIVLHSSLGLICLLFCAVAILESG